MTIGAVAHADRQPAVADFLERVFVGGIVAKVDRPDRLFVHRLDVPDDRAHRIAFRPIDVRQQLGHLVAGQHAQDAVIDIRLGECLEARERMQTVRLRRAAHVKHDRQAFVFDHHSGQALGRLLHFGHEHAERGRGRRGRMVHEPHARALDFQSVQPRVKHAGSGRRALA